MRAALLALAILTLYAGSALACDDHVGTCEIDDWRWYELLDDVVIEGSTTCDSGTAQIRLYGQNGGETQFLGIARAYIEGHAFRASVSNVANPESLSIKYSVDPDS